MYYKYQGKCVASVIDFARVTLRGYMGPFEYEFKTIEKPNCATPIKEMM